LKGFTPLIQEDAAVGEVPSDELPQSEAERVEAKRQAYMAKMGDIFGTMFGDDGSHTNETGYKEPLTNHYGNRHNGFGYHYQGPNAYPAELAPLRRKLGYNRMAPMGAGGFYRQVNPFRSVYGPNSTEGVYHPPGFDNTYAYTMPGTPQWKNAQKKAASTEGLPGLLKRRWPKGKAGHRWKSLSHQSTLKTVDKFSKVPLI
jgi:hypothetical protein